MIGNPIFEAKTKGDAARYLLVLKGKLDDELSKSNHIDMVLLLLCLEDAVNNLEIQYHRSVQQGETKSKEEHDIYVLSMHQFISEWYDALNTILNPIATKSAFVPAKIEKVPVFSFGITMNPDINGYLTQLYEKGQLAPRDWILKKPRYYLNRIPGWFFIAQKGGPQKTVTKLVKRILDLRDLYYKKGLLETMLRIAPDGTTVRFDDSTGFRGINLPEGQTVESVLEPKGISPRLIENHSAVIDWNSYFRETALESFKIIDLGKTAENLVSLRKEDQEIFKAYNSIESYSSTFESSYLINFKTFFDISCEIMYSCYYHTHTVGRWTKNQLPREKNLKHFKEADINKVLELLSKKYGRSYTGIVTVDNITFTSFRRLIVSRLALLEKCFGELLDNRFKGEAFEIACRDACIEKGWTTITKRVEIKEPFVTANIAYNLWGHIKEQTDVDLISSKNNVLLIGECKEIKDSDLESHVLRHFKKFCFEHYYRVRWIMNNIGQFEEYIGEDLTKSLGIDKQKPIVIIPFLMTNKGVELKELMGTTLISYLEFKDLVSTRDLQIDTAEKPESLELDLQKRTVKLPLFILYPKFSH